MNKDCLFCNIIKGVIPSFKIYEDNDYLAFLDRSQFTRGHTLVIPKRHYDFVWDVENLNEYMQVVKKISNNFKSKGYKYVDSMIFGRDIPHAHIHLIPHNDDLPDYQNALKELGEMSSDSKRWPTEIEGNKIVNEFKYEE